MGGRVPTGWGLVLSLKRRLERARDQRSTGYPGWGANGEEIPDLLLGTDKTLLECIACFEIWRRLGFTPDQIFFQVGGKLLRPPGYQVCMILQHAGKRFTFIAGAYDAEPDTIESEWLRVSGLVSRLSEETLQAIYDGATCKKYSTLMLKAMMEKGFPIALKGSN